MTFSLDAVLGDCERIARVCGQVRHTTIELLYVLQMTFIHYIMIRKRERALYYGSEFGYTLFEGCESQARSGRKEKGGREGCDRYIVSSSHLFSS